MQGRADLRSEKVVSDRFRFVWVGIPKAATRSILTALVREPEVDLGARVRREPLHELLRIVPELSDYYKFTFVRNPWSRVVSCYADKILKPNEKALKILERFPDLTPEMAFRDFVVFLSEAEGGSDAGADRHWLSQHRFITDESGSTVLVDHIGASERLQDEFGRICERLSLPSLELPYLNTRVGWRGSAREVTTNPVYYRDFYDAETRDRIARRYARDIDLFGYTY